MLAKGEIQIIQHSLVHSEGRASLTYYRDSMKRAEREQIDQRKNEGFSLEKYMRLIL